MKQMKLKVVYPRKKNMRIDFNRLTAFYRVKQQ